MQADLVRRAFANAVNELDLRDITAEIDQDGSTVSVLASRMPWQLKEWLLGFARDANLSIAIKIK